MDPRLADSINAAAKIKTSGRWAAMNEKIKQLAENPGMDNGWHVQLFGSLCFQIFSEYLLLKTAYEDQQQRVPSLLAWRARNLLELSVWCGFFTKSRENARRLYEDAGRDTLDILSAYERWGEVNLQNSDWLGAVRSGKDDLSRRAASEGIESLDGSYKRVAIAAAECGIGEQYTLLFKTLSKFAHPTAMQILAPDDPVKNALQRDTFFSHGCLFFVGAFGALERAV